MAATNENNTTEKGLTSINDGLLSVHGNNNNNTNSRSSSNTLDRTDPFGTEGNGTAKFIGIGSSKFDFHTIKATGNITVAASKRTVRMELSKNELLNMLCYMEGELQARDVVIAALRNERVKSLLHTIRHKQHSGGGGIGNSGGGVVSSFGAFSICGYGQNLRSCAISGILDSGGGSGGGMSGMNNTEDDCNSGLQTFDDPNAALFRDKIAFTGNLVSRQSSTQAIQADMEVMTIIDQQIETLRQVVIKQRQTHVRMLNVLTESLENNQRMRQELEDEKRKHEHDTAQGDDITYGLEMERTKLKQELESERTQRKKLEKDIKKLQEQLDFERGRQKQIVLLLLAERKKIIMKYIEERKRSEDLAQILSEEKQRSDTIAEGLEEESKKSLRMEAELEKQSLAIENERKAMKLSLAKDEKRIKELEIELAQLKNENNDLLTFSQNKQLSGGGVSSSPTAATLRMQQQQQSHNVPFPTLPTKIRSISDDSGSALLASTTAPSSIMNVAKIVQPTATVSSVPVSLPTTGIARSLQTLRQKVTTVVPSNIANVSIGESVAVSSSAITTGVGAPPPTKVTSRKQQQQQQQQPSTTNIPTMGSIANVQITGGQQGIMMGALMMLQQQQSTLAAISVDLQNSSPASTTGTICNIVTGGGSIVGGGCVPQALIGSVNQHHQQQQQQRLSISHQSMVGGAAATSQSSVGVVIGGGGGRGVPPPIPPNKPIVPPKREPSISRIGSISTPIVNNNNCLSINNTVTSSNSITVAAATPTVAIATGTAVANASAIQNVVHSNQIHSPTTVSSSSTS